MRATVAAVCLLSSVSAFAGQACHYREWRWNVESKRVVQQEEVVKDYAQLTTDEIDAASGCTVCIEDQQVINIEGLPEFMLCRKVAATVQSTLENLIRKGEKIHSVIGYRVGRTRGELDAQGNRSGFSNHSYGIAFDLNAEHNGLYTDCPRFGSNCRLLRGGPWQPGVDPYSLTADGPVISALKQAGFKWGGEIAGRQKDFMHFSPSGY